MSIPPGITRADVLAAIKELDAGADHPYGESTRYDLVRGRKGYPPKAVVGLAARRVLGRALRPNEFNGGSDPGQANHVLSALGFEVEPKSPNRGAIWTSVEIDQVVGSYEAMLRAELAGSPIVKTNEVRRLVGLLGRTRGSVEYKLENVSAVLNEEGLPWIVGYKPASNYQRQLRDTALARLGGIAKALDEGDGAVPPQSDTQHALTTDDVRIPAPSARRRAVGRPPVLNLSQGTRGAMQDEANRRLGEAGEEWVLGLEREKLRAAGRDDLAERIVWASRTIGDGLGFDIVSFDDDGSELHIEVKTTGLGPSAAFFLSPHELQVSREQPESFRLYRVFGFRTHPALYVLEGPLDGLLSLEVGQWIARP